MAQAHARHLFPIALTAFALGLLAGCQNRQYVQNLPSPNFNGPAIVSPAPVMPPAPQPQPPQVALNAQASPPINKQSNSGAFGAVPKSWVPVVSPRPWKWIVIHHSATPAGNAAVFDKMHRDKGWDELGYHFVIGNGTQSGDGQIEVGPRWPKQKWGAHAKTPNNEFNERGIGICLVGNFDVERPTPAQVRSLTRLVAYLMKTYNISARDVIGHGETKATDCPGRYMNVAAVRRAVAQALAGGANAADTSAISSAADELIDEIGQTQTAGSTLADMRQGANLNP
jgi:hypothetical protein